jgi:hypothetical protein
MVSSLVRETVGTVLILLVVIVALLIFWSVRRRRAAQESILPRPVTANAEKDLFPCLYVATVFADKPLDRVWAYGLGGRGRASVGFFGKNLVISRIGEDSIAIPLHDVKEIFRGGATIDRGVERAGLIQILWQLGGTNLITSLRITSNQEQSYKTLLVQVKGNHE